MKRRSIHLLLAGFLALQVFLGAGCAVKRGFMRLTAQEYFDLGEKYFARGKYDKARAFFDNVTKFHPASNLAPLGLLRAADSYYLDEKYPEASVDYESFLEFYPVHEKAVYARYQLGMSYNNQMLEYDRDQATTYKAMGAFQEILNQAPGSEYAADAREHIKGCRQVLAHHEFYIGRWYYRARQYEAGIKRLEGCARQYPDFEALDATYYYLGRCLLALGMKNDTQYTWEKLQREFPKSSFSKKAASSLPLAPNS